MAPRALFAASIQGAPQAAAALEFIDAGAARPRDLRVASVVEGIQGSQGFATAGGLRARYTPTSAVDVEPAPGARFLVVNELYHPAWRAYVEGREVPVYATNVVMRGLFIPAGARHVTLRFQPFLTVATAGAFLALAAVMLLASGWALRPRPRALATLEGLALLGKAMRMGWRADIARCDEQDVNREFKDGCLGRSRDYPALAGNRRRSRCGRRSLGGPRSGAWRAGRLVGGAVPGRPLRSAPTGPDALR